MKSKILTTVEAATIGRKMGVRGLIICRDEVDRNLWSVVTPGRVEAHEPMDEKTWRQFIAASGWIERPTKRAAQTKLEQIAREHLGLKTLEERKSDALDFHELSVWQIKAALQAAFDLGRQTTGK